MSSLIDTFIPSGTYNKLPHIHDVATVPDDHAKDLEDLRALLVEHDVPKDVSIRLIHKHYDAKEGEVMVFDRVTIPDRGIVQIMKPVVPSRGSRLQGMHYFVDDNGMLQAFEYADCDLPDMGAFQVFLHDFCRIVIERDLQHKFGLKLKRHDELDEISWTEFEFHAERGTIMLPDGMPMPDRNFDTSILTEWKAAPKDSDGETKCDHTKTCAHGAKICTHCTHGVKRKSTDGNIGGDGILYLGGQEILLGTPIHDVVRACMTAF